MVSSEQNKFEKIGLVMMLIVAIPILWPIMRPYVEPLLFDMHLIDQNSSVDMVVTKYYDSRGLGYINNKIIVPPLRNQENISLLDVIRKDAHLVKTEISDTIFVDTGARHMFFLLEKKAFD